MLPIDLRPTLLPVFLVFSAIAPGQAPSASHSIQLISGPTTYTVESSIVPDIDADGHDDILVRHANQTRIVSGRTGAILRTLAAGLGSPGRDSAPVGDLNSDGIDDVMMTDHTGYPSPVRVFSGADGAVLLTLTDPANIFGYSVAAVGDLNADGVPDLAVGTPFANLGGTLSGRVFVYSGASGALLMLLPGTAAFEQLGLRVAAAGDVNLDGTPDILVSGTSDSMASNGVVRVYSGVNGAVLLNMTDSNSFGYSVSSAGDVNGDSRPDILVGTPNFGGSGDGRVQVRSGLNGSVLMTMQGPAGSRFGSSTALLGDFNGDGSADYLIGAPGSFLPAPGLTTSRVQIRSGLDGSVLCEITGSSIGFEVGAGGDIDQDGRPDFTVNEWTSSQIMTTRVYSAAAFIEDPLPGTGDDLVLASTLNGLFGSNAIKFAQIGDALVVQLSSPGGAMSPYHAVLAAQAIVSAQGVVSDPGFPTIHFNLNAMVQPVVLYDSSQGYFATPGLPANGLSFFVGHVPAGFGGLSVIVQGFSLAGQAATNGIFAATPAHEIRMPF